MKSDSKEDFILQTALDYDLSIDEVKQIYNRSRRSGAFYERLEKLVESNRPVHA